MPTERFYRLSEEKRQSIHDAAKREFARVPLDKVSINQIIKGAEISRGSFYTYFEDKWDILSYLFEESQRQVWKKSLESLEKSAGDVWYMLDCLLEWIMENCSRKENFDFVRNVINSTSPDELMKSFERHGKKSCDLQGETFARDIYEKCSAEKLRIKDYSEFFVFFQMAMFSVAVTIKGYFEGKPLEKLRENYRYRIRILKNGVSLPEEDIGARGKCLVENESGFNCCSEENRRTE